MPDLIPPTVAWRRGRVRLIDQRALPQQLRFVECSTTVELVQAIRDLVLSVDLAGNLVILRTPPAEAQPLARALDEAGLPDVAGTIGGDDTVFVAVREARAAAELALRLEAVVDGRRKRP